MYTADAGQGSQDHSQDRIIFATAKDETYVSV